MAGFKSNQTLVIIYNEFIIVVNEVKCLNKINTKQKKHKILTVSIEKRAIYKNYYNKFYIYTILNLNYL